MPELTRPFIVLNEIRYYKLTNADFQYACAWLDYQRQRAAKPELKPEEFVPPKQVSIREIRVFLADDPVGRQLCLWLMAGGRDDPEKYPWNKFEDSSDAKWDDITLYGAGLKKNITENPPENNPTTSSTNV